MYVPPHFKFDDQQELVAFIDRYSFGLLVSNSTEGLEATHLPFLIEHNSQGISLFGHFARANSHWTLVSGQQVMVVFQGPHTYISPTWFESTQVPTWNYVAAHVYAEVELMDEIQDKHDIVLRLSDRHEKHRQNPWIPDYDDALLNAIVGFKLNVNRIEGKRKLSQNKGKQDRQKVISTLRESKSESDLEIAWLMQDSLL